MAIVIPGKRPSPRLEKSRVFGKKFVRAKKVGYAGLMLTSLVDMFTIIVIFLLANFSANGDILYVSKDIHMPNVHHGQELLRAPVVSISPEGLSFDGKQLASLDELQKSSELAIAQLEDALKDEKHRFEVLHQGDAAHPFLGMVNVQADQKVPFKVMKRVMFSCNEAGFQNITFAAMPKGSGKVPAGATASR